MDVFIVIYKYLTAPDEYRVITSPTGEIRFFSSREAAEDEMNESYRAYNINIQDWHILKLTGAIQ